MGHAVGHGELEEKAIEKKGGLCKECPHNKGVEVKKPFIKVTRLTPEGCSIKVSCDACGGGKVSPATGAVCGRRTRFENKLKSPVQIWHLARA